MTKYLLSVYYDEGSVQPSPSDLAVISRNVDAVHSELQAQGACGIEVRPFIDEPPVEASK